MRAITQCILSSPDPFASCRDLCRRFFPASFSRLSRLSRQTAVRPPSRIVFRFCRAHLREITSSGRERGTFFPHRVLAKLKLLLIQNNCSIQGRDSARLRILKSRLLMKHILMTRILLIFHIQKATRSTKREITHSVDFT